MKLSVVCSGFRVANFKKLYDSIGESFTQGDWELIICGPYQPDFDKPNFTFIQDFGSPSRCCQRALLAAKGDWISFAWDDGYYLPGLDGIWNILKAQDFNYRIGVVGKFYEVVHEESQQEITAQYQEMDDLYYIKTHTQAKSWRLPDHFKIFGVGMVSRKIILEIGGFDCKYELMGMSLLELSARLQLHGCVAMLYPTPTFTCKWSHGEAGHEVVQEAYEKADKIRYQKEFRNFFKSPNIHVTPDNWRFSPDKWERRFPSVNISVIMPTIRTKLLQGVYDSLKKSFHGKWELVLVGPYDPPPELMKTGNVQYIKSFASPIVCRQQALKKAVGDWICYAADDVTFLKNSLDRSYALVKDKDYRTIVVGKYLENTSFWKPFNARMMKKEYYTLYHHDALKEVMEKFPHDWFIINTGLVSRKLLLEVGGWDVEFEVCSIACCDISMRLQNYGCKCILQDDPIFRSTWDPGFEGDHGPIHAAHTEHDIPLLEKVWLAPDSKNRKIVDLEKWREKPTRWSRRFGDAKTV